MSLKQNCWEFHNCGREAGGYSAGKKNPEYVYIGRWNRSYGVGKSEWHYLYKTKGVNNYSERKEGIH